MRLLHTADWHLGHTLHDHGRELEHRRFLEWLLRQLEEHAVDVLLVAGDVFDTANPPATAQAQLYEFIAAARQRCPQLQIVIVGGNHDSAARLDAPEPVLRALGVRVIGGVRRLADGTFDLEHVLVPLRDRTGTVAAWLAAIPFLRRSDLPPAASAELEGATLTNGVRDVYELVFRAARARRTAGQALLAAGHLYVTGAQISELSERQLFRGHQDALPLDALPTDAAYVALGHLHRAQSVGRESVRYSGSPIPLALQEREYVHQVVLVELEGEALLRARALPIPRAVEVLRIPTRGALSPTDALTAIAALEDGGDSSPHEHAFLEIVIEVAQPVPGLRRMLDDAVSGKAARLVRVAVTSLAPGERAPPHERLGDSSPEKVFELLYAERHAGGVPDDVLLTFRELEALVRRDT